MNKSRYLNIYAQEGCHGEAFIIGQKQALFDLRNAIDVAIDKNMGFSSQFAGDGEGYDIIIMNEDSDETFTEIAVKYYNNICIAGDTEFSIWDYFKKYYLKIYLKLKGVDHV